MQLLSAVGMQQACPPARRGVILQNCAMRGQALIGQPVSCQTQRRRRRLCGWLGKEYRLEDVYEALRDLVREFSEVLDVKPGEWREDA